jgi:hypothetical protein
VARVHTGDIKELVLEAKASAATVKAPPFLPRGGRSISACPLETSAALGAVIAAVRATVASKVESWRRLWRKPRLMHKTDSPPPALGTMGKQNPEKTMLRNLQLAGDDGDNYSGAQLFGNHLLIRRRHRN